MAARKWQIGMGAFWFWIESSWEAWTTLISQCYRFLQWGYLFFIRLLLWQKDKKKGQIWLSTIWCKMNSVTSNNKMVQILVLHWIEIWCFDNQSHSVIVCLLGVVINYLIINTYKRWINKIHPIWHSFSFSFFFFLTK